MYTFLKRRYRRLRASNERGSALVLVIGIAAVLSIVVATGLSLAQSATIKSGSDRDAATAIAAAYAGIADYSARLTNDNTYVNDGDPAAPFSRASTLSLPSSANPAFCYGQTSAVCSPDTWAPVPGGTGNEAFRYEVDNAQFSFTGTVQLLATGRSGSVTRSVRAIVRQDGFLNYVYFTDFETIDPTLISSTGSNLLTECSVYEYATPTRNQKDCGGLIQFSGGDAINGPIRSNDALLICGGTFANEIETADPKTPNYLTGKSNCSSGYTAPTFKDKAPQTVANLNLPGDNTAMVAETASTDPNPGCMYTGPTAITFNSNGTMTVVSPWTKSTYSNVAQAATDTKRAAACGTPGTSGLGAPRSASNPAGGQTLQVPTENLIYVQGVPGSTSNPNYWGSSYPTLGTASVNKCTSSTVGANDLGYPWTSTNNSTTSYTTGTTYPVSSAPKNGQPTESVNEFNGNYYYSCTAGDAFITGVEHGQVTVAAQNYVYLTGNVTYTPGSTTDLLGIDGQKAIWVWNPANGCTDLSSTKNSSGTRTYNTNNDLQTVESTNNCAPDLTQGNRTIDAAMMSVADTFQVQNYNIVGTGTQTLTVTGAIVQKFRGPVGTGSATQAVTGFTKNYNYDARLASMSPPRFQNAVAAPWSPIQYSAASPAFSANGAAE